MDIATCLIYGFPALTVIITVVALARKVGLPTTYAPAFSIGCGLIVGLAIGITQGLGIGVGIITGIMLGASACGIYDAGKNTIITGQ